MSAQGRVRLGIFSLAIATALLAGGLAAFEGSIPAAALAGASAILVVCALFSRDGAPGTANEAVVAKVAEQVESGRKLVIYERETGLFAHWYVTLRGQEECDRAARYQRPLALLLIEPAAGAQDGWGVKEDVANWLSKHMRAADVGGYLGNGRCVAIMPEADTEAAGIAVGRLQAEIASTDIGCSIYPRDGATFDQLYAAAASRMAQVTRQVA